MSWVASLWLLLVQQLPGPAGFRLRDRYYRRRLRHLGEDVRIDVNVYIERPEYVSIGNRCAIDRGTMILSGPDRSSRETRVLNNPAFSGEPGEVRIGDGTHVSTGCVISGRGGVTIGSRCGIASNVTIHSFSHHYRSHADRADRRFSVTPLVAAGEQALIRGPVVIGDNVGVALNAAILPGAWIARDSFVAINAVVAPGGRFPANSIVGGDPARRLRPRFEESPS